MKRSLIFSFLFVFCLVIFNLNARADGKIDAQNQSFLSSKQRYYNTVAYNFYAGFGIDYKSTWVDDEGMFNIEELLKLHGVSGSFLFGTDFYLGGYFDERFNVRREYLISPLIGVEFGIPLTKIKNDYHTSWKESFNFVGKIGAVFKLKYDIDMKLYALFGLSKAKFRQNSFLVPDVYFDEFYGELFYTGDMLGFAFEEEEYKKWNPIYGGGFDFFFKNRVFVGFEFRYMDLGKLKVIERNREQVSWLDPWNVVTTENVTTENEYEISRYGYDILIKAGIAF